MSSLVPHLFFASSTGMLVCFILVEIQLFKRDTRLGVLGIVTCTLFALIHGWMKVDEYGIKKVMVVWTVLIAVNIVLFVAFRAHLPQEMAG